MDNLKLPEYELIERRTLTDIQAEGYLLRHRKSGARVFAIETEDENKVFNIGFRTPAPNSTGVPHIIEHSVLCGSEKFPVKDPFVELVKGSLNTFLNAMTYPDRTIYPIASCNDKDFQNLMDVYLDAVFHPNIYKYPEIFMQEGWSYSLEEEDGELTYNGVVYNEMKGAFSSPEGVLDRSILAALYPDTNYVNESGGNPENIPELSYEEFLDFHRSYYHPSNSYIYLYGDMDMEEKLRFIDREYLSHYEQQKVDSEIPDQKPFDSMRRECRSYSITEAESLEDNTYLSYSVSVGDGLDKERNLAFEILEYILIAAPGAPLKQALLDAGVGKDVYGGADTDYKYSMFSVVAKNANKNQEEEFVSIIRSAIKKMAAEGLDKEALESAINYLEFQYREADFGRYPKGLMLGLKVYESWIYDEKNPFMNLEMNECFARMKERVKTDYFERMLETYVLNNAHAALVIIEPEKGLTAKQDEALRQKLEAYKQSLSAEERRSLVEQTEKLLLYKETPSSQEDLKKIPMLKREDIRKEAEPFILEEREADGIKVLFHPIYTNGIGYLNLVFCADTLEDELLPYFSLLKSVLGYVDTKNYSYEKLFQEINRQTGGIDSAAVVYGDCEAKKSLGKLTFQISAKALYDKQDFALQMIQEILMESSFEDDKRMKEILAQLKSRMQMSLTSSGHVAAITRGLSCISYEKYYSDHISGIAYYKFIEELDKNYEQHKDECKEKLREVMKQVFCAGNLCVSYTSDEKGYEQMPSLIQRFAAGLYPDIPKKEKKLPKLYRNKEGFMTSSQVQYVARTGNYKDAGFDYNGCLKILSVIMNYEYLWSNIRVKGGAYGCMSGFFRNGDSYFVSYRDPNLEKTNEVFEGVPEFVENFTVDERDMDKYIIGTISDIDQPLTPKNKAMRALTAYMTGLTYERVQKERTEILEASQESIRALAPMLKAVIDDDIVCAVGNAEKIGKSELFTVKENLFE
ncbi:MAG: insulinase family protein [Lachnospiraceae bacterium]|nr:insulinase family protein [Lachnospiraceae bacterium]